MIINCLSFYSYHVTLVILGPDCHHGECYDFKLFILVYRNYSEQYPSMVMFGLVYWPWSGSPTKILFKFLVLQTLVSIGCFKNFVVLF